MDYAGLELTDPPSSSSPVTGLMVYNTILSNILFTNISLHGFYLFKDQFYFYSHIVTNVAGTHVGQQRESDPMELELL